MTPVEFYFDFASPYGFLAAMQIDQIKRQVRWRPFLLGAVYKKFAQSPLEHPLKRDYVIKVDAPRMARQIGLDLRLPADFPAHALPPARVLLDRPRRRDEGNRCQTACNVDPRSASNFDPSIG